MIAVIFNPTARGDKATAFRARLTRATQAAQAQGVSIELRPTRRAGDGVVQAHEAVASGCTTVVAAGGDGTVNEVVNGLARWPDGTDRARLAVLPLGTVNVFAKELGIPTDFDAGWQLLLRGAERRVDLGAVDLLDPDDGGETAAAWASFYGQDECLALLLANSANPSLGDRLGMTPLHWAAHEGRLNAARMLLDAGVDASAVDDKGDTPLAVARKNERLQVAELIEARGGVE